MKIIALTGIHGQGKYTLVDDRDYEFLSQWKWNLDKRGYVVRTGTKNQHIYMHRYLLCTPQNYLCDHKDGNPLNNQKNNLRNCSENQNKQNKGIPKTNKSGYKGVHWSKAANNWVAQIRYKNKPVYIGTFNNARHAGLAYDLWAKDIYGQYARTNFLIGVEKEDKALFNKLRFTLT